MLGSWIFLLCAAIFVANAPVRMFVCARAAFNDGHRIEVRDAFAERPFCLSDPPRADNKHVPQLCHHFR